jgi:hypothetical protein
MSNERSSVETIACEDPKVNCRVHLHIISKGNAVPKP